MPKKSNKYNHMLDVAFEVISPHKNWDKIPASDILDALEKRVAFLKVHPEDAAEAFGFCDTFEVESTVAKQDPTPLTDAGWTATKQDKCYHADHVKSERIRGRGKT